MRGDVGSNPAQGEFSFKHLFGLKYDYLGCAGLGFLIFCIIYIYIYIILVDLQNHYKSAQ